MRSFFCTLNLLASLAVAFSALMVGGMACDEGCGGGVSGWTGSEHSWQWSAIMFFGVSIFVAACMLFVLRRSTEISYSLGTLSAQGLFAGLLLLVIAGSKFSGPYVTLGILAPVVFGAASVAIMWGNTRPSGA
jgi:hypothetical protein